MASTGRDGPTCWKFGGCLVGVLRVPGGCLESVCRVSGWCLNGYVKSGLVISKVKSLLSRPNQVEKVKSS